MDRPVIGITVDSDEGEEGRDEAAPRFRLKRAYSDAVALAGGIPVLLPPAPGVTAAEQLSLVHGLLITGGAFDIDPSLYGEDRHDGCGIAKPERTAAEFALLAAAGERGMPVLGICGGEQVIAVAGGGTLWQDLPTQLPTGVRHEQKPVPSTEATHTVTVHPGSLLHRITGRERLKVNSTHHQAVRSAGEGTTVCATAPDGVVEGVEGPDGGPFLLGLQWHPELLGDDPSRAVYAAFIAAAASFRG